jgi:hypothetical protein
MFYRLMFLVPSILIFIYALIQMMLALRGNNMVSFGIAGAVAVLGAFAIFFNLDHMRHVRVSASAMKRMKQRRG